MKVFSIYKYADTRYVTIELIVINPQSENYNKPHCCCNLIIVNRYN